MATNEELLAEIEDLKEDISDLHLELALAMKAVSSLAMTNAAISFSVEDGNSEKIAEFYSRLKGYVEDIESKADEMIEDHHG